jgi:hypothetical protein
MDILNHPRNNDILYDPVSHTYWYKFEKQFDGITGWIKSYGNEFDSHNISKAVARRDGKTQSEVLSEWDEKRDTATDYGNFVHDAVERFANGLRLKKGQKVYADEVKRILKENDLEIVAAEFVVYDEDMERASPIDLLCRRKKTGKLVVIDVKTYEKGIQWEGFKGAMMKYPVYSLPDSNFYHTTLQVGWYLKQLMERYLQDIEEVGYILHLRDGKGSLVPCDENSIEMIYTLYNHEGYENSLI